MPNRKFFTEPIISYKDIESNLINIFCDSVITDTKFIITDISPTVLKLLHYKKSEVIGKSLSTLFAAGGFDIIFLLNQGYFTHTQFELRDKEGKEVSVFLSGYFLGLISDINGKIVILIKSGKNILDDKRKIDKRIIELNELIYRTSHDIRGPLATIKGLVTVAKYENNFDNIHNYLNLITKVSDKLDLVLEYMIEAIKRRNYEFCCINIDEFIAEINDRIKRLSEIYDIKIDFSVIRNSEGTSFYINPFLASILVENLILIIESLKEEGKEKYDIQLLVFSGYVQVKIQTNYLTRAVETYLKTEMTFRNVKELIRRSGYHYLNFRIIKICSEIIKSEIRVDNKPDPSLVVTIPSILNESK